MSRHFSLESDACGEGYQSPADVEVNMHRLASLGLEIHVTEMDVSLPTAMRPAFTRLIERNGMAVGAPECVGFGRAAWQRDCGASEAG